MARLDGDLNNLVGGIPVHGTVGVKLDDLSMALQFYSPGKLRNSLISLWMRSQCSIPPTDSL